MYAFIRGKLNRFTPISVVIDTNGVGYHILVPPSVFYSLPNLGEELTLHTSFIVRELSQTLYGFQNTEEKELFELLLDVNGVGPKMALSLIGHLPPPKLQEAIRHQDLTAICKVPGVGKKTAQRLLIEVQDKLSLKSAPNPADWAIKLNSKTDAIRDAMSALINLGYNQSSAEKALKKTLEKGGEKLELAGLITEALKHI